MLNSDLKLKLSYKSAKFLNLIYNSKSLDVNKALTQALEDEQNEVFKFMYSLMQGCINPENTIRLLNNFAISTYTEDSLDYHTCKIFIEIYLTVLKGNPEIASIAALSYLGMDFKQDFVAIMKKELSEHSWKFYFDENGNFNFNLILF